MVNNIGLPGIGLPPGAVNPVTQPQRPGMQPQRQPQVPQGQPMQPQQKPQGGDIWNILAEIYHAKYLEETNGESK